VLRCRRLQGRNGGVERLHGTLEIALRELLLSGSDVSAGAGQDGQARESKRQQGGEQLLHLYLSSTEHRRSTGRSRHGIQNSSRSIGEVKHKMIHRRQIFF